MLAKLRVIHYVALLSLEFVARCLKLKFIAMNFSHKILKVLGVESLEIKSRMVLACCVKLIIILKLII